jgi:hypothetical protein
MNTTRVRAIFKGLFKYIFLIRAYRSWALDNVNNYTKLHMVKFAENEIAGFAENEIAISAENEIAVSGCWS